MIHRSAWQGLDTLLIDTPLARCEVALFGAQVLSFTPRVDGRDLLWCSQSRLAPGRPVRGGVPLCWPWFARQDQPEHAIQHGFVRKIPWEVCELNEDSDGRVRIVMQPCESESPWPDSANWPLACRPRFEVVVADTLEMSLHSLNNTPQALSLTQALHTYFRVGDVRLVTVEGLEGLHYLDKLRDFAEFEQTDPWRFDTACDRIYLQSGSRHRIQDPVLGRTILIDSRHSASTVVWNPGATGIEALGDVPRNDWYQYLCVEAGNCAPLDRVLLAPGGKAVLTQRIGCETSFVA
jgi:glucose-6-phosphate 1-epimerase